MKAAPSVAATAALLLCVLGGAGAVRAQTWTAAAQGGRLSYDGGATNSASAGVLLSVGREDPGGWLGISAGIPLEQGDALWGGAGLGRRLAVRPGPVLLGLDVAGSGFAEQQQVQVTDAAGGVRLPGPPRPTTTTTRTVHGWALAGQALPVLGITLGPARLEARYGVSGFHADLDAAVRTRNVRMGDAALVLVPAQTLVLGAVARRYAAPDGASTYAGASAGMVVSRLTLRGTVGTWLAGPGTGVPWSARASLALGDHAGLLLSAARDTYDPLYAVPSHTSWGIGLTYRLGGADAPPEPVPAAYRHGTALITLPLRDSREAPRIAGDFNHWKPAPMVREGGHWAYRVAIPPGVYHYAFVNADGTWFVPDSVPGRTDDGMGGEVAVLVVRE